MGISRTDLGNETILTISGTLDAATIPRMASLLEATATNGGLHLTVHTSKLRHVDSFGIRAIIVLARRLAARGGSLRVCGLRGQPLALFRLLRLDVTIGASVAEALAPRTVH